MYQTLEEGHCKDELTNFDEKERAELSGISTLFNGFDPLHLLNFLSTRLKQNTSPLSLSRLGRDNRHPD